MDTESSPAANEPFRERPSAVVAQRRHLPDLFPRSFADGNGDGTGDLAGVRARLGATSARPRRRRHLVHPLVPEPPGRRRLRCARLPQHRPRVRHAGGRRAADPRGARPGIRTIVDVVPNHISSEHQWFQAAAAGAARVPGARALLVPPDGGPGGDQMPTGWVSSFQGDTWTRTTNPTHARRVVPAPVHAGAARPELGPPRRAGRSTKTCCGSGSTAAPPASASTRRRCLLKDPALPDLPDDRRSRGRRTAACTRTGTSVHDIYRSWRAVADEYGRSRACWSARCGSTGRDRLARYLRPDEMHTAFNFDFLRLRLGAPRRCASSIERTLDEHSARSARPPPGCSRTMTSPARSHGTAARTPASRSRKRFGSCPTGHRAGPRRARAAALLIRGAAGTPLRLSGRRAGASPRRRLPLRHPGPHALPLRRRRSWARRMPRSRCRGSRHRPPCTSEPRRASVGHLAPPARRLGDLRRRVRRTPTRGRPCSLYRQALRLRRETRACTCTATEPGAGSTLGGRRARLHARRRSGGRRVVRATSGTPSACPPAHRGACSAARTQPTDDRGPMLA